MRWAVVLVALAGCGSLLGLDNAPGDDPDGDKLPSSVDNCDDVANPDQSDLNHDGIGDACQLCMATDPTDTDGDGIPDECDGCDNTLPDGNGNGVPDACEHPHDEDGDGIADDRDNCPSVPNDDQIDSNEATSMPDGVGTACDDSAGLDRQLFDPFTEPNQLWFVSGGSWLLTDDQIVLALDNLGAFRYATTARSTFAVTTKVTLTEGEAQILMKDGGAPGKVWRVTCALRMTPPVPTVAITTQNGTAPPITVSVPYPGTGVGEVLRLGGAYDTASGDTQFTCSAGATVLGKTPVSSGAPAWTPGIGGVLGNPASANDGATVKFDYFDLVTSVQ
jgi:hypothetical protein